MKMPRPPTPRKKRPERKFLLSDSGTLAPAVAAVTCSVGIVFLRTYFLVTHFGGALRSHSVGRLTMKGRSDDASQAYAKLTRPHCARKKGFVATGYGASEDVRRCCSAVQNSRLLCPQRAQRSSIVL